MNPQQVRTDQPVRKIQPPNPRPKWIPEGGLSCLGPECGKPIPAGWYGARRKNYFCCATCEKHYYLAQRPLLRCTWCNTPFRRMHRGNNRPICSKECFKAWREAPLNNRIGRFKPQLDSFLDEYVQKSPATRSELRSNVGMFLAFLVQRRIRSLNSVRPAQITEFLRSMRDGGRWHDTTNLVNCIGIFFDWLIVQGKRDRVNPVVPRFHSQKRRKRLPRPYSEAELLLIWKLLEADGDKALMAAVAFGQESGCRISEVAALRVSRLDLLKQEALVRLSKTGIEHLVPFHTKAKRCLADWLDVRGEREHDFVFIGPSGKPMSKQTLRKRLNRVLCGEGKLSVFSFHRLRAYAATTLAKGKSDVLSIARTIGWQDLKSAQQYIELDTDDLRETYHRTMEQRGQLKASRPVVQTMDEFFANKGLDQGKS